MEEDTAFDRKVRKQAAVGVEGEQQKVLSREVDGAVLGETLEQVVGSTDLIMGAVDAGKKVICIMDQNLAYAEGTLYGTGLAKKLIDRGFKELLFIRSGDDSEDDVKMFLEAGVHGVLSKRTNMDTLQKEFIELCNDAHA